MLKSLHDDGRSQWLQNNVLHNASRVLVPFHVWKRYHDRPGLQNLLEDPRDVSVPPKAPARVPVRRTTFIVLHGSAGPLPITKHGNKHVLVIIETRMGGRHGQHTIASMRLGLPGQLDNALRSPQRLSGR